MATLSAISPMRDVHHRPLEPEPGRQQRREEVRIDREEEHLEDGVEGDETGAVLGVAFREVVPDDHHRDASSEPDEDETEHVLGLVAEEHHREPEHQERPEDPVLDEREREYPLVAKDLAELLVADLRKRRVHHQDEPDRDRDRRRPDAHSVERGIDAGHEEAERDADAHGQEDPECQVAIEEREVAGDAARVGRHVVVDPPGGKTGAESIRAGDVTCGAECKPPSPPLWSSTDAQHRLGLRARTNALMNLPSTRGATVSGSKSALAKNSLASAAR